jgi:cullin-4
LENHSNRKVMKKAAPKKKLKIRLNASSTGMLQRSTEAAGEDFESKWSILEKSISCIYNATRTEHSLEELYRTTEEICSNKLAANLYQKIETVFGEHLKTVGEAVLQSCRGMSDEQFLNSLNTYWGRHCDDTQMIRQIILTLDRTYALEKKAENVKSIWDLGLHFFRLHVLNHAEIQSKTVGGIISLIQKERKGESVPREMLVSLLKMFSALEIYTSVFEVEFLKVTKEYYFGEGQEKIDSFEVSLFLKYVYDKLREETDRVSHYLQDSTRRPLIHVLESVLLSEERLENIMEKGFDSLLDENRLEDVSLMYSLFLRVNAISVLDVAFNSFIKRVGVEIVADRERDKTMVQDLLDFKQKCNSVIERCFAKNNDFYETEKKAFEHFINVRANKPAELMAKFIDAQLKSSKLTEEQIDELLTRVMVLFRFINGKDVFEAFYKKDLAKRLLLGRSASMDWETLMIRKLKAECGSMFTTKLEGMFKDLDTSNALLKEFTEKRGAECPVTLQLNVLTAGYWPEYVVQPINLPDYLSRTCAIFVDFYSNKHEARKLTWHHSLSYVSLNAFYPKGVKKQFHVSLFQACVLLLFNETNTLSFAKIAEATGLPLDELKRVLKSLSMGKVRILVRSKAEAQSNESGSSSSITNTDSFRWKEDFKHKMMRIKINTIQVQETIEENDQVRESVLRDRQYQIDAAIVRIMKMRRSLAHSLLVSELYTQLKFPLKPADIKKRIESLIDREYLERDEETPSVYIYKA